MRSQEWQKALIAANWGMCPLFPCVPGTLSLSLGRRLEGQLARLAPDLEEETPRKKT